MRLSDLSRYLEQLGPTLFRQRFASPFLIEEGHPDAPGPRRAHFLWGRSFVLGRAEGCEVTIPARGVSKRHCQIELTQGGWTLTDLESHNGTVASGRRLSAHEPVPLRSGDVLEVGTTRWAFLSAEAALELLSRHEDRALTTSQESSLPGQAPLGATISTDGGLIAGQLSPGRVAALLAKAEQRDASGELALTSPLLRGRVLFHLGRPFAARTSAGARGAQAVRDLVEVAQGSYLLTPYREPEGEREIHVSFAEILLPLERERSAQAERAGRESLQRSQRLGMVGQAAAGLTHDFQNLLAVIQGYSERLLSRASSPEDRAELGAIQEACGEARQLLQRLFRLGNPLPAGAARQRIDLNALLEAELSLLSQITGSSIQVALAERCPTPVEGDPEQLRQVLLNLVINARDAMPAGGRIELACGRGEAKAWLEVRDQGQGLGGASLEQLCEPFFTTKPKGQGSGLGLAVIKQVASDHGGALDARERREGGAVFQLTLPLAAPSAARAARPTILVVDEDPRLRASASAALQGQGYRVEQAGDPLRALALAERMAPPPDLLLTNVTLPDLAGPLLAQRLRRIHPRLAVLYLSDEARPDLPALAKPVGADTLLRAVADALAP